MSTTSSTNALLYICPDTYNLFDLLKLKKLCYELEDIRYEIIKFKKILSNILNSNIKVKTCYNRYNWKYLLICYISINLFYLKILRCNRKGIGLRIKKDK